jgi:hypothetical protein
VLGGPTGVSIGGFPVAKATKGDKTTKTNTRNNANTTLKFMILPP